MKKPRYVLDSYALLGYLRNEPVAERVDALLGDAAQGHTELYMSTISLGEISYIVERRRGAVAPEMAEATRSRGSGSCRRRRGWSFTKPKVARR